MAIPPWTYTAPQPPPVNTTSNSLIPAPPIPSISAPPTSSSSHPALSASDPAVSHPRSSNQSGAAVPVNTFGVDMSILDEDPDHAQMNNESPSQDPSPPPPSSSEMLENIVPQTPSSGELPEHTGTNSIGGPQVNTEANATTDAPEPRADTADTAGHASTNKKRVFPSNARPLFGFVEGVGCGIKDLSEYLSLTRIPSYLTSSSAELARKRALKKPFQTYKSATRNYKDWVKDFLSRV